MRYGSVVVAAVNGKAKVARRNQEGRRENVPRSVFLCTCWGRERGEGEGLSLTQPENHAPKTAIR